MLLAFGTARGEAQNLPQARRAMAATLDAITGTVDETAGLVPRQRARLAS